MYFKLLSVKSENKTAVIEREHLLVKVIKSPLRTLTQRTAESSYFYLFSPTAINQENIFELLPKYS